MILIVAVLIIGVFTSILYIDASIRESNNDHCKSFQILDSENFSPDWSTACQNDPLCYMGPSCSMCMDIICQPRGLF